MIIFIMIFEKQHHHKEGELVNLGLWEDEPHVLLYNMYGDRDKMMPNYRVPKI